jgi:hypothetical protein
MDDIFTEISCRSILNLTTEGTTPAGQSVACRAVADEAAAESMQLEEEDILSRAINAILPFTRGVQSDIQRQAVYALANMAASGKYRAAAMEAGAVPILVDLLAAQDDSIRLQVMSIRACNQHGGMHTITRVDPCICCFLMIPSHFCLNTPRGQKLGSSIHK